MDLPLNRILLGDCLELLKTLPDDSIDSVVTDVPYGLGSKEPSPEDILAYLQGASSLGPLKKGRRHCLNSASRASVVADTDCGDPPKTENLVTFEVTLALGSIVPPRVVELDDEAEVGEHEVNDKGPLVELDDILMDEINALTREGGCDSALRLRERKAFSGCIQTCGCFTPHDESCFRILVWLSDESFGESKTAASILTAGAAEACAMLTLDVTRLAGELSLAGGTDESDAGLLLASAEDVGTLGGASRLLTALQVLLTGQVRRVADGTLTFDIAVPAALLRRMHEPRVPQRDFMNRSWELPSVQVWREVYRVLKPGGHVASFGGTRTFDLISIGLRMAGFECRDTISREFPEVELPILQWIQSQGMPKSSNISANIDKKLGRAREVVGTRRGRGGENLNRITRPGKSDSEEAKGMGAYGVGAKQVDVEIPITEPASEEAAAWSGWGSALKPSWEPILLFRKPFKGTLADNVLEHGTGGLNIDATRVRHASKADFDAHKAQVDAIKEKGGSRDKSWKNSSDLSKANDVKEGGRWPANCLLEHSALCQKLGTQEIAPHPQGPDRFQKTDGGGFSEAYGNQLASDGPEVAPIWSCAEGCPVREMNEQSGERPSTLTGRADPNTSHKHPGHEMNPNSAFLGERSHLSRVYADGGGAARFFTQFEGEPAESSKGRWPSNVVLQHAEGCTRLGTKRVKGITGGTKAPIRKRGVYTEAGGYNTQGKEQTPVKGYSEPGGKEEVDSWECVDGCPVKALDDQSGERRGGGNVTGNEPSSQTKTCYGEASERTPFESYADSGGASRFFSQFDGVPFKYVPKANRKEAGCGEFEVQHITVKPLALMRWLVKLVTPRGVWACPYCKGHGNTNDMSGVQARVPPKATGRGGLLDQLPEQDSGTRRTDHSGETLPKLRGAIHPSLQGRQVLFQRVSGEGTGQANASLPGLPEVVSASADSGSRASAVVLKGVRQGQSKEKARNSKEVLGVSADLCAELPGGGPPSSVLLEGLRSHPLGSAETGPEEHHEGWLRDAVLARASDGHEGGHATGTSIGDGEPSPTVAQVVGSSPSHQRSENGQSCRESSGDAEGGSRRTAEASAQATGLPPLPGVDRGGRKCPRCGSGMIQRPGVVLDMYCGSGTTPHAAVLEGMQFIGMERDEASHAEATRRLEIVLKREEERRDAEELFEFSMGRG